MLVFNATEQTLCGSHLPQSGRPFPGFAQPGPPLSLSSGVRGAPQGGKARPWGPGLQDRVPSARTARSSGVRAKTQAIDLHNTWRADPNPKKGSAKALGKAGGGEGPGGSEDRRSADPACGVEEGTVPPAGPAAQGGAHPRTTGLWG